MAMLTIIAAAVAGGVVGALAAGLACLWMLRHRKGPAEVEPVRVDPGVDARIRAAASQWAMTHNRPEAAGLVAGKLRLLYVLRGRRTGRYVHGRRQRWFG